MDKYIAKSDAVFAACKVLTKFGGCSLGPFCPDSGCREVREVFKAIPAADVVEVVRCGECKYCVEHYDTDGNVPYWTCKEWDSGTDYDGYCHYGKRKDGGQDDE